MYSASPGLLPRLRTRLFGERDTVGEQLRDIARQGSAMARLAHAAAFLLIVLFSIGSLIGLSSEAFVSVLRTWQRAGQLDIPAAISVAVSTLLVLCMDVGIVYAASMLRLLASRRADRAERRVHQLVLVSVALLEAATYGYMAWLYDQPGTWIAWTLILARALSAPLLATYLSLARALPVTSRDILAQVEVAAGQGVIREVVTIAADSSAPLAEKAAIFGAAAVMQPADRSRLDHLLSVVSEHHQYQHLPEPLALLPALSLADLIGTYTPSPDHLDPDPHPTGPGSPSALPSGNSASAGEGDGDVGSTAPVSLPARRGKRTATARKATRTVARRGAAFALLDADPAMTREGLRQELHCRQSDANRYYAEWQASHRQARRQAR